jgi:hypothetical protein
MNAYLRLQFGRSPIMWFKIDEEDGVRVAFNLGEVNPELAEVRHG